MCLQKEEQELPYRSYSQNRNPYQMSFSLSLLIGRTTPINILKQTSYLCRLDNHSDTAVKISVSEYN